MNQDPLGLQAYVAARDGDAYVLVKDAETRFGRSRYVALYNAGEDEHVFAVTAKSLDLGQRIVLRAADLAREKRKRTCGEGYPALERGEESGCRPAADAGRRHF